jgi:hypothetical protein
MDEENSGWRLQLVATEDAREILRVAWQQLETLRSKAIFDVSSQICPELHHLSVIFAQCVIRHAMDHLSFDKVLPHYFFPEAPNAS